MSFPPQGDYGLRLKNLYDANTLLKADVDNTPEALTIAEQRLVGRITGGEIAGLTQAQVETLLLQASARYSQRPFVFNYRRVTAQGKPTLVNQGIFFGFSLPTYAADEELFACVCIPPDWIGSVDPIVYVGGWLVSANNAKKFNLQISWEHWTAGDDVPATSHDVEVETTTGNWNAKHSIKLSFTVDYDVNTPNVLLAGDALGIRIRRLAASGDEIAGEVVVEGAIMVYQRGSFGMN